VGLARKLRLLVCLDLSLRKKGGGVIDPGAHAVLVLLVRKAISGPLIGVIFTGLGGGPGVLPTSFLAGLRGPALHNSLLGAFTLAAGQAGLKLIAPLWPLLLGAQLAEQVQLCFLAHLLHLLGFLHRNLGLLLQLVYLFLLLFGLVL